jgi:hypothetical protein
MRKVLGHYGSSTTGSSDSGQRGQQMRKEQQHVHDLVVWQEGPLIKEKDWWSFATLWDYNLYWQSRGEPIQFQRYTFEEWKAKGLDTHSVIADPLFVDPAKNDFRLRPESPAFKLGFRPINLADVGPHRHR